MCVLRREELAFIEYDFTALRASNGAKASVHLQIDGVWKELDANINVCHHMTLGNCPLVAGLPYAALSPVTVGDGVSDGTKATIMMRSVDDQNLSIVCTKIAVQIEA